MEPVEMQDKEKMNGLPSGRSESLEDGPVHVPYDNFVGELPIQGRPINVHSVSDARRLLSRLIRELQKGNLSGKQAKDITYIVSTYVHISKESELEARLEAIEKKMNISYEGSEEDKPWLAGSPQS